MILDKRLIFFLFGFVLALILVPITCKPKDINNPDSNDGFKSDTIYVDRVIEVPGKSGSFTDSLPKPIIEYRADPKLLEEYGLLKTENERLQAYAKAITKREYERSYLSLDSIVRITVNNSVTGTLDFQVVRFDIAPQEVLYKEKIITNTIDRYPDFSLSLGGGVKVPTTSRDPVSFEWVIGVEDNKGYQYQLGFDTKKEVRFTLTKKLFTKF